MRPLPNPAIEVEAFRSWLLADQGENGAPRAIDRELAAALSEGIPAAWALYQDVVKPRLIGALFPLCHDSKLAVEIADAMTARLYASRRDPRSSGLADLPADVPLFQLCRFHVLAELAARQPDDARRPGPGAVHPDAISAARCLGARRTGVATTANDPCAPILALEASVPAELRQLDLADQLERQRRSTREHGRTVKILNLPAVLVLAFFVTLTAAGAYIASSPRENAARIAENRVRDAILAGRFDEALRQLSDDPPAGLDGLSPQRPESRVQRVRELRARNPQRPPIAILSPRGRIDTQTPKIVLDRDPSFTAELKIRIVDASTGSAVLLRTATADDRVIDPQVQLPRGGAYVLSIESPAYAVRSQFEVLSDVDRVAIERRIGLVTSKFEDPEPSLLFFLRAHVYRAEDCFEACLAEWRSLGALYATKSYPREEAACVLDADFRLPWHALTELSRSP